MHYFIEKEKEIVPKNNPKPASKLFEGFHPIEWEKRRRRRRRRKKTLKIY